MTYDPAPMEAKFPAMKKQVAERKQRLLQEQQFANPPGLFPEDHPAMRQRTTAEFSPQEFQEKPGAWFHATYRDKMPRESTSNEAAGIHLGTLKAAKDRVDTMGPRTAWGANKQERADIPADIHVRRLKPTVQQVPEGVNPGVADVDPTKPHMKGSPERPKSDLGHRWDVNDDGYSWGGERGAEKFGEFYRNDTEDQGSVSIRVPNHKEYLDTHTESVNRAIRNKQPRHPLAEGLLRDFGGKGMDEPIKYQSNKDLGNLVDRPNRDPYRDEPPDHESLLPYKLRGNPQAAVHNPAGMPSEYRADTGKKSPAITFAATKEEAHEKTYFGRGPNGERAVPARWLKNYPGGRGE